MPSERPETWSDWAHVERIAGAPMPAIPSQVAFVMGAAKAAVVSRILSMASSGRARFGSSAIENTRLRSAWSSARARNATDDFVSSMALVSAACATSATDLWLDSSAEADWTASSRSRWPTAAPMASRSLPPSLAMRLTGVYFRVPHARETSSKVPASIPWTGSVHQAKGGSHWLLQWGSLSQGAEGGVAGSGNGSSGGFASGGLVRVARLSGRHGCSTSFWIGQRLDESDSGAEPQAPPRPDRRRPAPRA